MHRKPLLELLAQYRREWPPEEATTQRMIAFVTAHTDCFERSLSLGHVTGSAWLVNRKRSHVLLTHHRKLNKWLQLGGHADGDSDILAVAMKEAVEESGLPAIAPLSPNIFDIDIHEIPARKSEPAHFHYDVRFALCANATEQYVVSDESHDLAWIDIARLATVTTETSMLRMADKWHSRE